VGEPGEVGEAIIKVGVVDTYKPDYVHFADASGKKWNCNDKKYIRDAESDKKPIFREGRKLKVFFRFGEAKQGFKPARWINELAPAGADEATTWPDKEPYGGGSSGGGSYQKKDKGEFRTPEQIMRSSALGLAVNHHTGKDGPLEDVIETAQVFFAYIFGAFETKTEEHPLVEEAQEKFDAARVDADIPDF